MNSISVTLVGLLGIDSFHWDIFLNCVFWRIWTFHPVHRSVGVYRSAVTPTFHSDVGNLYIIS